jgi:hypothetical protein
MNSKSMTKLPANYIDPEHTKADRKLLKVFYSACRAEGGSADEIHLRGLKAVLADWYSHSAHSLQQLQQENHRFREPERTMLCDILANGALLPDPEGKRYGIQRAMAGISEEELARFGGSKPQPIPVSWLPWRQEGWCNAEGKCWLCGKIAGDWRLVDPLNSGVPRLECCFSVALPWWAIPLPAADAGEVQP